MLSDIALQGADATEHVSLFSLSRQERGRPLRLRYVATV
jgi:hypothetical protein